MRSLKIGRFEIYWLQGGTFLLDGGAMFGPVPKALWSRKLKADSNNCIPLANNPILVKTPEALVLIDTGLGNKLTPKQKKIFQVKEAWRVPRDLKGLGIRREDINIVILTHFDFDHSGGVVVRRKGRLELTFPNARHIIQNAEWKNVLAPDRRSMESFWPINHRGLAESGRLELVKGRKEISKGITLLHTGGHNAGHQAVIIESGGETAIHMADLLPTRWHYNPLWLMAYDNYPVEAVKKKEELEALALHKDAWLLFYHDPSVLAAKFDAEGRIREELRAG